MGVNTGCPRCGWPAADPAYPVSSHATARAVVDYVRCVCGLWLVVESGRVVAAAGAAGPGAGAEVG
ncbi:hypothetical protein CKY47_33835 [Saccharothrix yanglingensis]|uniref:Uncharacterized protein n=1 Tax=Saccharothrix yanglingensis TaxID=659496 RepID=A0ABU0X9L9_9PSEU|nr:hypothetical protein [Saccharothrix yanglingensis]